MDINDTTYQSDIKEYIDSVSISDTFILNNKYDITHTFYLDIMCKVFILQNKNLLNNIVFNYLNIYDARVSHTYLRDSTILTNPVSKLFFDSAFTFNNSELLLKVLQYAGLPYELKTGAVLNYYLEHEPCNKYNDHLLVIYKKDRELIDFVFKDKSAEFKHLLEIYAYRAITKKHCGVLTFDDMGKAVDYLDLNALSIIEKAHLIQNAFLVARTERIRDIQRRHADKQFGLINESPKVEVHSLMSLWFKNMTEWTEFQNKARYLSNITNINLNNLEFIEQLLLMCSSDNTPYITLPELG